MNVDSSQWINLGVSSGSQWGDVNIFGIMSIHSMIFSTYLTVTCMQNVSGEDVK